MLVSAERECIFNVLLKSSKVVPSDDVLHFVAVNTRGSLPRCLHGAKTEKNITILLTDVKTSNLTLSLVLN
jgi:hypothetical protein